MSKETMKLALEALEGLEALLLSMGLTHLIVYGDAEKAITNLQKALANEALDKKAENARELGLDYEPVCNKDPQGCWNVRCQLGKKCKNTPAQQEPVDSTQISKVWWDGEKLMAEPIDPASMYEDNEVAQPDSTCNNTLRAQGKGYPRTCKKCGKGPCIADRVQPEQRQPDAIPDAFNDWWNADYDPTGNPFGKDTHAYWAWAGWKAAKQPAQQEPVAWMDEFGNTFPLGAQRGPKYLNEPMKPLYTSPPAQRTWVGLTDEQILELNFDGEFCIITDDDEAILKLARAIEAKLKEKNT